MKLLTQPAFFASCLLLLIACLPVLAADSAEPATKDSPSDKGKDGDATHVVATGPLKITVSLDGVFEAVTMEPLAFNPKQWSELVVEKAVAQGTKVKPGDAILWLNTTKIDEQIDALTREQALSELALRAAEDSVEALEKSTPLDLTAAKQTHKAEQQDLAHYLEVQRPFSIRGTHRSFERSQQQLEYAQEELNQLKQMYEEDDLTEETEEIILKRAERAVDSARFYLESAEIDRDQTLKFDIPRRDAAMKLQAAKAEIEFQQATQTIPLNLSQAKLNLEKQKIERKQAKEKLAELRRDREAMVLKSPIGGLVYYGACVRGKWATGAALAQKLRPGGRVNPREVVMTIAAPQPLQLRAEVPEKNLHWIKPGLEGDVTAIARRDVRLKGVLSKVSAVPVADGKFDARIDLGGKGAGSLVPGMNGKVKFTPYAKRDALLVPKKAVFTDDWDEEVRYVYVKQEDGHERRAVEVGHESGENLEILDGLAAGDVILTSKPQE